MIGLDLTLLSSGLSGVPERLITLGTIDTHLEFSLPDMLILALIGFIVVFVVLIVIQFIIKLIGKATASPSTALPEPDDAKSPSTRTPVGTRVVEAGEAYPGQPGMKTGPDKVPATGSFGELELNTVDDRTAALLMAIVADHIGAPLNELRFISIREVDNDQ